MKIHGSDSNFKFLFQNEGLQFETWRHSQSEIKFSFCCYSHELIPYFDNQGQFWKPQNLRKTADMNLMEFYCLQWVKIEIQKFNVCETAG